MGSANHRHQPARHLPGRGQTPAANTDQDRELLQFNVRLAKARQAQADIGFEDVQLNEDVAKVSVIGVGMRSHAGVAKTMFTALAEKGVNIQVISTSEIKISVLIDAAYTELAVRALHAAYELDKV
jgi:aspartokinase